jgi:NTF2-like N-terminal transpeptidase domain
MYNDPNQPPQQPPYGQPQPPYYGPPQQPPYGQPPYGPPQQPYGQPQYGVPPVPSYVPQQPPKKRRTGLWIFLGILAVLVLACLGVAGALYIGVTHNPATDVANKYYTAIQSQDYATAYSYLDASSITFNNQNLTQSLYTQAAQAVDAQKGKVTSYSITSSNINTSNGVNTATFTVSVTRNGSPYDVHLKLQQEGSNWKIVSIDNI